MAEGRPHASQPTPVVPPTLPVQLPAHPAQPIVHPVNQ